jgi:cysteine dioxygenase
MPIVAIDEFARRLREIPERDFTISGVLAFLREYAATPESLAPYLRWNRSHYTRNLIDRTPLYELIAICWEIGQASAIHNHAGQNCWMAAAIGRMRTQNYKLLEINETARTCKLSPTDQVELTRENPVAIDPTEPIHWVANPAEHNERAVSLHIYSRPYDRCLIYSLEKGTYGECRLCFNTEFGRDLVPA